MLTAQVRGTENPSVGGSIPPLAIIVMRVHSANLGDSFALKGLPCSRPTSAALMMRFLARCQRHTPDLPGYAIEVSVRILGRDSRSKCSRCDSLR